MDNVSRLHFLTQYRSSSNFYDAIPSFKWEEWRNTCLTLKEMYGLTEKQGLFCFGSRVNGKPGSRIPDLSKRCKDGSSLYFRICRGIPTNLTSPHEERFVADFIYLTSIFFRENIETNLHFSLLEATPMVQATRDFDFTRLNYIKPYVVTSGKSVYTVIPPEEWSRWRQVTYGIKGLFGFIPMPVRVPLGQYPNRRLSDLSKLYVNGRDVALKLSRLPFDRSRPKEMDYFQAFIDFAASFLLLHFEKSADVIKKS